MPDQKKAPQKPKESEPQISEEVNQIMGNRAKCLDKLLESHKREYESCLRLEKELTEGLNENKKAKRLHNKEIKEFEEEIEKQLEAERSKLKKEKRVYERQNKAMKNLPNRREREEIEALTKQLKDLEENMKMKEQRNRLTTERLKKQVTEAKERYEELTEERDNIYLAVKGVKYEGAKQEFEEPDENAKEQPDDNTKEQPDDYADTSPNNIQQPGINFYQPPDNQNNDDEEEKNEVDLNDMSHSPQFGIRQENVFSKVNANFPNHHENNFMEPNSEGNGDENVSEEPANNTEEDVNEEEEQIGEEEELDLDPTRYDLKFPEEYHNNSDENRRIIQENISNDGKVVRWFANKKKEIIFRKGVRKEIFPDGYTVVYFKNRDIKQTYPDGKVVYYFDEARTTQTTETNGIHIFKFDNGQIEKHFPDGTKQIKFEDGTTK